MAAPDMTLSRPGVVNDDAGSWAKDNALFLKVFSGEVITAFERECVFGSFANHAPSKAVSLHSSLLPVASLLGITPLAT